MSAPVAKRNGYHHGDLRRSLIAFALRRLRRGGVDAFSLREVARALGVSSGAVYNHFRDREELLAAVAVEGFRLLARRVERTTRGLSGAARLDAVGSSYVAFASAEPWLFRLMFSRLGTKSAGESQREAGEASSMFQQLRSALAEVAGVEAERVDPSLVALAWSTAHGAASLICDGVWRRDDPQATLALRRVVELAAISPPAEPGASNHLPERGFGSEPVPDRRRL